MTEFVDYIQQGKVSKAKEDLINNLQDKLNDKVELRKKEISSTLFTGTPTEEEEHEVTEEASTFFAEANKMANIVKDILDAWEKSGGKEKDLVKLIKVHAKKNRVKEKDLKKAVEAGHIENVDVINKLKTIKETKQPAYVIFKDNSKIKVDDETSSIILDVYENLNKENQEKLVSTLEKNQNNFLKMSDFAVTCFQEK